ncbi:MAG: hypothetical protein NOOUEUKL_001214 [Candidatus Fervidibacter sp.]
MLAQACREGVWILRGELLPDEEMNGVLKPEEQARELMAQGDHDLAAAKANFNLDLYDIATFLTQQAAGKFLKVLYLFRFQTLPPRTHDLERLAVALGAPS